MLHANMDDANAFEHVFIERAQYQMTELLLLLLTILPSLYHIEIKLLLFSPWCCSEGLDADWLLPLDSETGGGEEGIGGGRVMGLPRLLDVPLLSESTNKKYRYFKKYLQGTTTQNIRILQKSPRIYKHKIPVFQNTNTNYQYFKK